MEEEEEEEKEEKKEEEVRRKAGMGKDSVETDVDRPDPNMPEADTGGTANEAADARSEELRTVVDHLAETLYGDDEDAIVRGIDLFTSSVGAVEPKVRDSEVFRRSVLNLQEALKAHGHDVPEDGILGPMTKTALRQVGESINPPATEPGPEGPEPTSVRPVAVSDRAVTDIEDDRLGFTPYVLAIVRFLRARETESPLAITVNARWGRGKTSFMSMIETQLSRISGHEGLRFATAWFNPWKYSDREQVWAAYLARTVQDRARFISTASSRFGSTRPMRRPKKLESQSRWQQKAVSAMSAVLPTSWRILPIRLRRRLTRISGQPPR